ncbi:MAG: aspartyl protease family protein, partial [bacterium]
SLLKKWREFMRINGEWFQGTDGILRPVIRGEVLNANGLWEPVPFLVDTGADRTVFSAAILYTLDFQPKEEIEDLGGIGGVAETVAVTTKVRMVRDDSRIVVLRGEFAAFTKIETVEISVLGRDIMSLFAVIVDQPGDVVSLVREKHAYTITNQ